MNRIRTGPDGGAAIQRILAAASELFSLHGYESVSMSQIAGQAGVSKANVFHHFRSKNELYIEVLREACRESREELDRLDLTQGCVRERLKGYAARHLEGMLRNDRDSRLILREVIENEPGRARQLAEDVFRDGFVRLVETLRESQRLGAFRADLSPADLAVFMLSANVFFTMSREVLRHLPGVDFVENPGRYSGQFMDILLRGASPETATDAQDEPKRGPHEV